MAQPPSKDDDKSKPLDDAEIDLLKAYGKGPYVEPIKNIEKELKEDFMRVQKLAGIQESDTGMSMPSEWLLLVK